MIRKRKTFTLAALAALAALALPGSALAAEFTAPAEGAQVRGTVTLAASVSHMFLEADGVEFKSRAQEAASPTVSHGSVLTFCPPLATCPYTLDVDTRTLLDGNYTFIAETIAFFAVPATERTVTIDNTAPSVGISGLSNPVESNLTVSSTASDVNGIASNEWFIDGTSRLSGGVAGSFTINPTQLSVGTHTLKLVATDPAGNASETSTTLDVASRIDPDTTSPTVEFISPAAGATLSTTLSGAHVLTVTASDDSGTINSVRFYAGNFPTGTFLGHGSVDGAGHYNLYLDVNSLNDGPVTIYAKATDPSGNVGTDARNFVRAPGGAAVVTSVDVPAAGTYKAGDKLAFTLHYDRPVMAFGITALVLEIGGRTFYAEDTDVYLYSTQVRFEYLVPPGLADSDGITVIGPIQGWIEDDLTHQAADNTLHGVGSTANVLVNSADPTPTPTPTPTPSEPTPAPAPVPAPAPKDTLAPTKPSSLMAKINGGQLQVSFGSATDNVKVVGYKLFQDGTAIATIDGTSFKQPLTLGKPGKSVLQLRAFDAAGNQSDPLVLTMTRLAAPKVPNVKPAWAWKLARWQDAPTATRGIRPHIPTKLPNWYGKWNAWHKAPVKVTVG